MFAINFTFALITLSVVPVLFTFILLWQKARVSFIRIRQAVSVVNSALQENVSGIRVIQNLSRENINARHFKAEIGGVVFQDPFLFSGTIHSNICYANQNTTEEEMISAAKTVYAHDFIMKLENGYDTLLYERGQNLSMGQQQLLSFAHALLANPLILLLDETKSNVDSYNEYLLQQALENLLKGKATLVIAHRLSTVRNADHILVMDRGLVVEEGSHEELLKKWSL